MKIWSGHNKKTLESFLLLQFNSDGWRSRYRSAASRLTTASVALSHRNVQDGICDAEEYDAI